MGTITLKNVRTTSDVTMNTSLKDGGVYIDWSELADIKAWLWSDAQKALAGRCDVRVDTDDPTNLICEYASTKAQYPGINRLVVQATYMGETKTYDKPAFNFVRWTAGQTGEQVTIDDPDVDVAIEVTDVSSSILQRAISAALAAAAHAEHAASLVPLQVLQDCVEATEDANEAAEAANAAGITSVEASVADNEPGTPSVESTLLNKILTLVFHHLKGVKGDTGATPNITVGTVTTGEPGTAVVVTMTGTAESPVLNITIPQGLKGDQGNTGSSVDYPFELVNNLTTDDATKALSAAQGVVLAGQVSQLQQEVTADISQLEAKLNNLANTRYYGIFTSASQLPADASENGYAYVGSSTPLAIYEFDGEDWNDTGVTVNSIQGEPGAAGVGFASVASPTPADGTMQITLSNGDVITMDLNHNHNEALSSQPPGGFLPDVCYHLGEISGTVTFNLAAEVPGNINHYFWTFSTGATAPNVSFPSGISWRAGSPPNVAANKKYEISILNGVAYYTEVS